MAEATSRIEKKLASSSTYVYNDSAWKKFWNGRFDLTKGQIFKFHKNSSETLVIKDLELTDLDAFMYGLILGSSRVARNETWISVNKEVIPRIREFCAYHETWCQCQRRKLRRKGLNKKRSNRFQVKYMVRFSNAVYHFFKSLGMNLRNAAIPEFLSENLKQEVLKGYLHSQRCTISFKNYGFNPKIIIRSKHLLKRGSGKSFMQDVKRILSELGIKCGGITITRSNNAWNQVYIHGMENVKKLAALFDMNFLKLTITVKLMKLQENPDFKMAITQLSELSLFILGLCHLHFKDAENAKDSFVIEYTVIQENLLTSSNNIRKELYLLEEFGFIRYFARGKKEFIKMTSNFTREASKKESNTQMDGENTFECDDCGAQFGYLDAWGEQGFACPTCASTKIMNAGEKCHGK